MIKILKLQIMAIVQKEIIIPDYLRVKTFKGELDYLVAKEKQILLDETTRKNIFSIKARLLK